MRTIVTTEPLNAAATQRCLLEPVMPRGAFFTRSHFPAPGTDPSRSLTVTGRVAHPLTLSPDRLRGRPARTLTVTLECAGNGRTRFRPTPGGTPWGTGAVSTAAFTGTPLAPILDEAGIAPEVVEVVFTGADRGETKRGEDAPYARSLPLEVARHPDTLLVWAMNEEPLAIEHGYPLRLLVPGWYGMASVKWLTDIRAVATPFDGFFQVDDYVLDQREGLPDGTPLSRMAVNSMILSPEPGHTVPRTGVLIRGIAWSGQGAVRRVEVSDDGGDTWGDARVEAAERYAHHAWTFEWTPQRPGRVELLARATDEADDVQPEEAPWNALGYQNNSWSTLSLVVSDD